VGGMGSSTSLAKLVELLVELKVKELEVQDSSPGKEKN
ncbi:hypothetical protein A2U01_0084332, partial [Trifolium medium]|nr:hypothetical protein [Trifolium medium]